MKNTPEIMAFVPRERKLAMAEEENGIALDGTVQVIVDEQYLWAKIVVTQPQNGGKPVDYKTVQGELAKNGVFKYIDEEGIREYLDSKPDGGKSFFAAKGEPAVDGEHGAVDYMFPQKDELKPQMDEETGTVNFKELGKVRNIKRGTIIANIKLSTTGTPGCDIRGAAIAPYPGTAAKYNVGSGTQLSTDQTKILASDDGNLRWDKDRFVVDTVVNIKGDVDAAIGNIDFIGDVIISGNIKEGYFVRGKNITVKENVTNAKVHAMGNIDVKAGAICADITCDGEIKIGFAENSKLRCKGKLSAKSLVNCNVIAEDEVIVGGTQGIIVGGECICYRNVTASQIGSPGYAKTAINLGNTVELMKSHNEIRAKYEELSKNYKKMKTLYDKLSDLKKHQTLNKEQEDARKQAFMFIMNERSVLAQMTSTIEYNETILAQSRSLQLIVKARMFPGVTLKLYSSVYDNTVECGASTFYLDSNNEIKMRAGAK